MTIQIDIVMFNVTTNAILKHHTWSEGYSKVPWTLHQPEGNLNVSRHCDLPLKHIHVNCVLYIKHATGLLKTTGQHFVPSES